MSGYLQRLATSAMRPKRRVQPLVGGLYTRQPEEAMEEVATTIVSRAASPDIRHLPSPIVREARPRISPSESGVEETAGRSAAVEPLAAPMPEEPRHSPLLVSAAEDFVFASQGEERSGRTESPARRMEQPAEANVLIAAQPFVEHRTDSQAGIASRNEADRELRNTRLRHPSAGPVRTFARPPVAQPQTPSPVRSGGDDIQIHIGRVEVIAVPQQAAHPAPARRGPSLEEYLQGRDRRSR